MATGKQTRRRKYLKGWARKNKAKIKKNHASWKKKNPESYRRANRNYRLKKEYGITESDYGLLLESQGGRCGICRRHQDELKYRLNVDHDHDTGEVRGLLCSRCNVSLGVFGDSVDGLMVAIAYLQKAASVQEKTPQ
jgi:hypothetical protein